MKCCHNFVRNMNLKKLLKISLPLSILLCMAGEALAGGPQVLPNFASHRKQVFNDPNGDYVLQGGSSDPFEKVNRGVWTFNYDYLDKYALRPIAHSYLDYVPEPVRKGVHNVLSNYHEVNNIVNNLLIAEFADSGISAGRLIVNSTIGILGLMDVAKDMGMENKSMDFSTVLGKWGVNNGSYIQVPFIGMTTPRQITGTIVDNIYFPYSEINWAWSLGIALVDALDTRASLVNQEELLDGSLDPYVSARDFYLQYQDSLVLGKEGVQEQQKAKDAAEDKNLENYLDEIDE